MDDLPHVFRVIVKSTNGIAFSDAPLQMVRAIPPAIGSGDQRATHLSCARMLRRLYGKQ
jgi:hypothetical protein